MSDDLSASKRLPGERLLGWACILAISGAVLMRVFLFTCNRSFSFDEAALASSVVQRGYWDLTKPLDFGLHAPLGYLWSLKTLSLIAGPTERVLRFPSLLASLASILLFHSLLSAGLGARRPLVGTALFAGIPLLAAQAVEFSPAAVDTLAPLLTVSLLLRLARKQSATETGLAFAVLAPWFSFPAVYTILAASLAGALAARRAANRDKLHLSILTGLGALASFCLVVAATPPGLADPDRFPEWGRLRFPLLPSSQEDWQLIGLIVWRYFAAFGSWAGGVAAAGTLGAVAFVFARPRRLATLFFAATGLLVLAVSALGGHAMLPGLLVFLVPLNLLLAALVLDTAAGRLGLAGTLLSLWIALISLQPQRELLSGQVFRDTLEVNPLIHHLATARKNTVLYVPATAIPQYEFKTGFKGIVNSPLPSPVESGHVIYGSPLVREAPGKPLEIIRLTDWTSVHANAQAIEQHPRAFLLLAGDDPTRRAALLETLAKSGTLTEILVVQNTLLSFYERWDP